ncbi:MAG TPA: MarR family transcriptional regulator [Mycobacteriales bacterium]|nr:MarR family transcriptional regulator [Mycobacteriales bacterium]
MAGEPAGGARESRRSGLPEVIGTGFLLSALGAHSAMSFGRRLAQLHLTPPHVGLLRGIAVAPGRSQQAIAEQFGMPPSRLVAFIDDLEQAGLVERRRDPNDRRAHNLFLTAAGEKALAKIAEIGRESEEALLRSLTGEERTQLHRLLERLMADHDIAPGVHPGYRTMKPDEGQRH